MLFVFATIGIVLVILISDLNAREDEFVSRMPECKRIIERSLICAKNYSNTLGSIFGGGYSTLIYQLLESYALKTECKERNSKSTKLVLNVGPGSSGTRSLFLAMVQLNFTSYHLGFSGMNCNLYYRHKLLGQYFSRDPLVMTSGLPIAFWGDNPVPNYWWKLYHEYPEDTQFIMTDIDDYDWLKKRRKPQKAKISWEATLPLAFPVDELRYNRQSSKEGTTANSSIAQVKEHLLTVTNVFQASNETNSRVFQTYRDLLRCTLPEKQLLWVRMKDDSPEDFWANLVQFLNKTTTVTDGRLNRLVAAGKPYFGDKSCRIGSG